MQVRGGKQRLSHLARRAAIHSRNGNEIARSCWWVFRGPFSLISLSLPGCRASRVDLRGSLQDSLVSAGQNVFLRGDCRRSIREREQVFGRDSRRRSTMTFATINTILGSAITHKRCLEQVDDLRSLVRPLLRSFVAYAANPPATYTKAFFNEQLDAALVNATERDNLRVASDLTRHTCSDGQQGNVNVLYHSLIGLARPREFSGTFVRDAAFLQVKTLVNTS
jgi:hypothetical protein